MLKKSAGQFDPPPMAERVTVIILFGVVFIFDVVFVFEVVFIC